MAKNSPIERESLKTDCDIKKEYSLLEMDRLKSLSNGIEIKPTEKKRTIRICDTGDLSASSLILFII